MGFKPLKGDTNGSDLADTSDRAAHGRFANLGLQPKLGLRSQWWLGVGAGGRAGARTHGVHSPWLLTRCDLENECAEVLGACDSVVV